MSAIDEKALEAAHAAAVTHVWSGPADDRARDVTRTIITAYLSATSSAADARIARLEEEIEQLKHQSSRCGMSHTDEAVLEKLRTLSDAATQGEWETVHVATGRGVDWVVTKGLKPLLRVHRLPQRNADEEASNGRLAAAAVNYVRSLIATAPAADARIARLEEALRLIANATHPRFRTDDDIDLLYANEKAFGDCINIARAALGSDAR